MFNSAVMEVVIGLAFTYLLLSLMCSAVTEIIARRLDSRSKILKECINGILDQTDGLAAKFWSHPLVNGLSKSRGAPSYVSSRVFATALLDILAPTRDRDVSATNPLISLKEALKDAHDTPVSNAVVALLDNTETTVDSAMKSIEDWYSSCMERASGWYKAQAQVRLFVIAILVVGFTNTDTIAIGRDLWNNPALRQSYVQAAESYLENRKVVDKDSDAEDRVKALQNELDTLGIEIGIHQYKDLFSAKKADAGEGTESIALGWLWASKIIGLLITTLAVSLGAPFWFDLLNKFVNLRQSGTVPAKGGAAVP